MKGIHWNVKGGDKMVRTPIFITVNVRRLLSKRTQPQALRPIYPAIHYDDILLLLAIPNVEERRENIYKLHFRRLKACAQRFRYALFAFIHTQTYFEYYTLTLRLASLVKRAVIYAYWTKELFDICRENVSHMATLPSVARHVIHADNLIPRH